MTTAQRTGMAGPTDGMLVFDSDTQSYWFRQSGNWVELPKGGSTSNYWQLDGLAGNEIKNTNSGGFWSANPTGLSSSANNVSNPPTAPVNGSGTRLMWIPSRSAFRVGTVDSGLKSWDADSIGLFSFASGYNSKSKGSYSMAAGFYTSASGVSSTAIGKFANASGNYSTAMGDLTTASGTNSTAIGYGSTASGSSSTAMGLSTSASGSSSTAMGSGTTASGLVSTAMGGDTKAIANFSTSIGYKTTASGNYSTSMGHETTASGEYSLAMGDSAIAEGSHAIALANKTFASGDFSTAMGDNTIAEGLSSAAIGYNTKALGDYSVAMGSSNTSSGDYSTVSGSSNTASGNYSLAFGRSSSASGINSIALGYFANASDFNSVAIGEEVTSSGQFSLATGFQTMATGTSSSAFGAGTIASGVSSTALGGGSEASAPYSTALGYSTLAAAYYSTAMGHYTVAKSVYGTAIGTYNDASDSPFPSTSSPTDRIFQIGNGSSSSTRSNAMTVLRSGYIGTMNVVDPQANLHLKYAGSSNWDAHLRLEATNGEHSNIVYDADGLKFRTFGSTDDFHFRNSLNTHIATIYEDGDMDIDGTLTQSSDRRLKKDIVGLRDSAQKLAQLNGVQYFWRDSHKDKSLQTGLIAQEVQGIFPELVNEGEDGYLSVNYIGLIPHLIEAYKDLLAENEALKNKVFNQAEQNKEVNQRLARLETLIDQAAN